MSRASNTQESALPDITAAEAVYCLERALEHPVGEDVQKEGSQELIPSSPQPTHVMLTAPILYRPSPMLTRESAKTRLAGSEHGAGDA